jgi:hypothetical protein
MLDELLLGDPMRRFAFGLALLLIAGLILILADGRAHRARTSILTQRTAIAVALSMASVGVGVVFSAFWGVLGAIVFLTVAMVVCGVGMVVTLGRGA